MKIDGVGLDGVIDPGILPESKSFDDKGLVHHQANGREFVKLYNFTCNNKIIGARPHGINDNSETLNNKDLESP
ncbi:subtilisin protease SBT4.3 [Trifolium repens]|nr:subtilisin protease SBT4.3 [Trifolium repens]